MAVGRGAGGILALLELIEEHRAAFDYDWRTRFHLPVSAIPGEMPWDEALRLTQLLRHDTSSQIAAALEGWSRPISNETLVLADIFDLDHEVNSKKKPKPHSIRPWDQDGRTTKQHGNVKGRSRTQVEAILARAKAGQAPV